MSPKRLPKRLSQRSVQNNRVIEKLLHDTEGGEVMLLIFCLTKQYGKFATYNAIAFRFALHRVSQLASREEELDMYYQTSHHPCLTKKSNVRLRKVLNISLPNTATDMQHLYSLHTDITATRASAQNWQ